MSAADELLKQLVQARMTLAGIGTCAEYVCASMRETRRMLDKASIDERAELLPLLIDGVIRQMEITAASARGVDNKPDVEAIFKQAWQARDKHKGEDDAE